VKLLQVPTTHVHQTWAQIAPLLDSLAPYSNGEGTTEQAKVALINGTSTALVIVGEAAQVQAVIVGEWKMPPGKRIFFISAWAGSNAMNDALWSDVQTWVKHNGGTTIQGAGRDAVFRLHRQKRGFKKVYIVYEKEIA
jgi:acetaldehyde dehydrogenase (acetylating)